MKKVILMIASFAAGIVLTNCEHGAKDDKNEVQPYATTDTNKIEKKHDPFQDSTNKSDPGNAEKRID
jgi:hypothetical protein